jgi:two-component system sensor histidine kinase UhpB
VGELLGHNRELAQQLIAVQDNERRALARELHDELGQRCSALRAEAALIERTLASDPAAAAAAALRIDTNAEGLYQQVREMLRRLRPADLDELGLVDALQALCERWETSSGVACVFHHDGGAADWQGLGDTIDVTIYRVVQEGLSNVLRHARAGQVRIALRREAAVAGAGAAQKLRLSVQDDGAGMDPHTKSGGGLGLLGARERAALLGGELTIDSAPGQGLRLQMWLPLPSTAAAGGPA